MDVDPRAAGRFALRLGGALLVCVVVWVLWGSVLARASIPLLRWTYERLDHDHTVRHLSLSDSAAAHGRDQVLLLEVAPDGVVLVGRRVVNTRPDGWARVSVLSAFLWQPVAVAIAAALAWPAARAREWPWRLVALPPLLAVALMADLPFVLRAEVWRLYAPWFVPGDPQPWLIWADFLQDGGRYVLGALAGAGAIALGRRLVRAR